MRKIIEIPDNDNYLYPTRSILAATIDDSESGPYTKEYLEENITQDYSISITPANSKIGEGKHSINILLEKFKFNGRLFDFFISYDDTRNAFELHAKIVSVCEGENIEDFSSTNTYHNMLYLNRTSQIRSAYNALLEGVNSHVSTFEETKKQIIKNLAN